MNIDGWPRELLLFPPGYRVIKQKITVDRRSRRYSLQVRAADLGVVNYFSLITPVVVEYPSLYMSVAAPAESSIPARISDDGRVFEFLELPPRDAVYDLYYLTEDYEGGLP